jgi:hypothetical protein
MKKFDWKQSLPVLKLLAKSTSGSTLLWQSFSANQRCALHELLKEGFVVVESNDGIYSVNISDKGRQEIFIDSL